MYNDFADPLLASANVTYRFSNVGNDIESGEPLSSPAHEGATAWAKFVAPSSGPFTFHTRGSAIDTILSLFIDEGSGPDILELTLIDHNDDTDFADGSDLQSKIVAVLEAGKTYYVQIAGFDGEEGFISFTIASGDVETLFRLPIQAVAVIV